MIPIILLFYVFAYIILGISEKLDLRSLRIIGSMFLMIISIALIGSGVEGINNFYVEAFGVVNIGVAFTFIVKEIAALATTIEEKYDKEVEE